jgi:hypothetical protein
MAPTPSDQKREPVAIAQGGDKGFGVALVELKK